MRRHTSLKHGEDGTELFVATEPCVVHGNPMGVRDGAEVTIPCPECCPHVAWEVRVPVMGTLKVRRFERRPIRYAFHGVKGDCIVWVEVPRYG